MKKRITMKKLIIALIMVGVASASLAQVTQTSEAVDVFTPPYAFRDTIIPAHNKVVVDVESLTSQANASKLQADLITRETASAGAKIELPEGTNNGSFSLILQAPASLAADRTITAPDADVTLADIATAVQQARTITAGDGLTGGGDLTEDRTVDLSAASLARIVAADVAEETQSVTLRGDATIQIVNPEGASIAARHLVRVWFGTEAFGAPNATNNTVAIETGTEIEEVVANADYHILTDAQGAAEVHVTIVTDESRFVMVEVGGKVTATELEIVTID